MPHQLLRGPLAQSSAFRYDSPAMEPADPSARRGPHRLERRTFMAMIAGGLLVAPLARRPNELWSWDITKLLGPTKWSYFPLYVMLDVFSRRVVGWMVAHREST